MVRMQGHHDGAVRLEGPSEDLPSGPGERWPRPTCLGFEHDLIDWKVREILLQMGAKVLAGYD